MKKNFLSLKDCLLSEIQAVFDLISQGHSNDLAGYVMGTAFFQNSTRTRLSFEAAMLRCGGHVTGFSDMKSSRCQDSYFQESLDDFSRVISQMVDLLVIRHPEDRVPFDIANKVSIPVINAGDGHNEHPSQALQDIWLMQEKAGGSLQGKVIGFVGDISRTFRSMIFALRHFQLKKILFLMPDDKPLPKDITAFLHENNMKAEFCTDVLDILREADFVNTFTPSMADMDRQKEEKVKYIKIFDKHIINIEKYNLVNRNVFILNAGPRMYEVATDMDNHPCFLFLEQVKTGVLVKTAIVKHLLHGKKSALKRVAHG